MTTPTLDDLLTEESADTIKTTMLGIASALGLKVSSWAQGAVTRTILAIDAEIFAAYSTLQVAIAKGGFLDYAEGQWLTLLSDQMYDVQRIAAERASGIVTLSNSTAAVIPVTANSVHLLNSTTGATYIVTSSGTIPASGSLDFDVEADEAGSDSDAAAGEIDALVNTILGVTCTNADPVLGSDEETDAALRVRCRESLAAASPDGPKEIYSYVAKTLSTTASPITRTRVITDALTGDVALYLANVSGAPTGGDVTLVDDAIHLGAEPQCVTATAYAASNVTQAITATVYVQDSSLSDGDIEDLIDTALTDYAATTPIGGYIISGPNGIVDKGALESAILNCLAEIKSVSLALPAGDVTITPTQVLTIGAQTITVTRI